VDKNAGGKNSNKSAQVRMGPTPHSSDALFPRLHTFFLHPYKLIKMTIIPLTKKLNKLYSSLPFFMLD